MFPPSYKLLFVSKTVKYQWGYYPKQFYNDKNFWLNNCVHPEDRKAQTDIINSKAWPKKPTKYIYRIITSSGKIKWLESHSFQTNFYGKKCIGFIERETNRNIRKEILDILRKENISKEAVNKIKFLLSEQNN